MAASKETLRQFRRLGRLLKAMGGWISVCVNCDHRSLRLHPERMARFAAIKHVEETGHSVRVLDLR